MRLRQVAGHDIRCQSDIALVGSVDHLIFGRELEQCRNGTEGLFTGHVHSIIDTAQNGQLMEVVPQRWQRVPAQKHFGVFAHGILDVRLYLATPLVMGPCVTASSWSPSPTRNRLTSSTSRWQNPS